MSDSQVVQTVSRFARNLDADGSVRVPRQIGAAPLGPPGPYRSASREFISSERIERLRGEERPTVVI